MMSSEVGVALFAATVSLVVASMSFITAIFTNRQSAKAEKNLEELKFTLSRSQAREQMRDNTFTDMMAGLKAGLQAIQRVKDEIQLILSAVGNSMSVEVALGRFGESRTQMLEVYEQQHVNLTAENSEILHQAKNVVVTMESTLQRALSQHTLASELDDESRRQLLAYRDQLSSLQHELRDAMTFNLMERITV
jgi:hypothetical protein